MNVGVLTLHFNETVNVSSLIEERFTLQDNTTRIAVNHTLTTSTVQTMNAASVNITFSIDDLNEIKREQFCYEAANCYLTFEYDATRDMVDIPIEGIPDGFGVQVDRFVNDTTRPELEEFTRIDLATGVIRLSFSETVNTSSFDFATVTLQDLFERPLTMVNLTGGFTTDNDTNIVDFTMLPEDRAQVQANNFLCTHRGNCYITFTAELVDDMVGNPIQPSSVRPFGYIVEFFGHDEVDPELIGFDLDMNSGDLVLSFNEPVKASSLQSSGITIQSSSNVSSSVFQHQLNEDGTTSSADGTVIVVKLDNADVNALKASYFAKDRSNTYIAITARTITDTAFTPNDIIPIVTDNALQVSNYTNDTTDPEFTRFTLDMDSDILTLTFNEPVLFSNIDCSSITLYNSTGAEAASLMLSGCIFQSEFPGVGQMIIAVSLTRPDITLLKLNLQLATTTDNTYLELTQGAFTDTNDNPVVYEPRLQASNLIPDQTRPSLISFLLDVYRGTITLSFNDVVLSETFDPTSITLQHAVSRSVGRTFAPSTESDTSSPDGYTIVLDLSHNDLLRLKSNTGLARSAADTYITVAATLIDDTAGIDVVPITDGNAIQVLNYTADEEPPVLSNYTMNMTSGELYLTFSDTVNLTTFDPTSITIQNDQNVSIDYHYYRLTGGMSTRSDDGLIVTLTLTIDDLNAVKRNTNISVSRDTTYIAIEEGAIEDLSNNPLVGIPNGMAQQASVFIADTAAPVLIQFNLDMNTTYVGCLYLTFDETVNAYSIDPSKLYIQSDINNPQQSYRITSTSSSTDNDTVVKIYSK